MKNYNTQEVAIMQIYKYSILSGWANITKTRLVCKITYIHTAYVCMARLTKYLVLGIYSKYTISIIQSKIQTH